MSDLLRYLPASLTSNPILEWLRWFVFTPGFLGDSDTKYRVAFYVALACFAIVAFYAGKVYSSPRLFTALGLFAGAWLANATAVFAGRFMYGLKDEPKLADVVQKLFIVVDRVDDLTHFLILFVGAILVRDGGREVSAHRFQVWGMTLLSAMVIPHYLYVYGDWRYGETTYFVMGTLLACLSFWALAAGARAVAAAARANAEGEPPAAPNWLVIPLVLVVAIDIILNITRTAEVLLTPRDPQSTFFVLAFSLAKVLLTVLVCLIVRWRAQHPDKLAVPIP
jgi:hypothetical protein